MLMPGIFFGVTFQAHVFFWVGNMKLRLTPPPPSPVMYTASTPLGYKYSDIHLLYGTIQNYLLYTDLHVHVSNSQSFCEGLLVAITY